MTPEESSSSGSLAVSGRATMLVFEALEEVGLDTSAVVEGVSTPIEKLRDPSCRISWRDFAKLLNNAEAFWKEDEIEQFGWRFLRREWPQRHSKLARLMAPADAYHFAIRDGEGRALSCVEHFAREVRRDHVRITSILHPSCEPSPAFFLVLKGMFTAIPSMLGYAPARVEMETTPLSARFDITLQPARPLARLLRPLTYPLRARARTRDLVRATRVLDTTQGRYLEEMEIRREAETALRESETRLNRAQQVAHIGSWEWMVGSPVLHWSDENLAIFGFAPGESPPSYEEFLERIHPDDRENFINMGKRALRGGGRVDLDYRFRLCDGRERIIHGRGEVEFDDAGQPVRVLGTCHDVTESRRIAHELDHYQKHLEEIVARRTDELARSREGLHHAQRLASLGTLAAGVAHQINNPVGSILTSAEYALMVEGDADRDEVWKAVLAANALEAKRCGRIVRSLLQFARDDEGDRWVDDLNDTVRRACLALESYARERSSRIELAFVSDPLPALMCPIELEQVFVNLIRNALESRASGVKVIVSTAVQDESLVVRVSDDGPGIEAEHLPHLFDPFYTGRLSEGGTGLGLSVAHGIVLGHGGAIRLRSRPGEGSTFTVTLPRADGG